MNYDDHRFNELEERYYKHYLTIRKKATDSMSAKFIEIDKYDYYINSLKKYGHVELSKEFLGCKDDLELLKQQIFKYYDNCNSRVLKNPFEVIGLYEFVKNNLVPFASTFYDCIPTIGYIKIIKSYQSSDPKDTQFFHRDPGSYKLLKAIIYLSDVDSDTGPLVYVEGSNRESLIGLSGRDRIPDQFVENRYKNKIKEITGPYGQVTFFDASGIHKGKLPTRDSRIAIIVNFSLHPEYGQKDNYSKISYRMKKDYSELDLVLLDSCMPIFGENDDKS